MKSSSFQPAPHAMRPSAYLPNDEVKVTNLAMEGRPQASPSTSAFQPLWEAQDGRPPFTSSTAATAAAAVTRESTQPITGPLFSGSFSVPLVDPWAYGPASTNVSRPSVRMASDEPQQQLPMPVTIPYQGFRATSERYEGRNGTEMEEIMSPSGFTNTYSQVNFDLGRAPSRGDLSNSALRLIQKGMPSFAIPAVKQSVFGADSTRNAVMAYLEVSGRHDVVVAMLEDEKAANATSFSLLSGSPRRAARYTPSSSAAETRRDDISAGTLSRHNSGSFENAQSAIFPGSPTGSYATFHHGVTPKKSPSTLKGVARKSYELLRRGIMERQIELIAGDLLQYLNSENVLNTTAAAVNSPATTAPPAAAGTAGAAAGATSATKKRDMPPSDDFLKSTPAPTVSKLFTTCRVLPSLCGLEQPLFPDLTLLYLQSREKFLRQYEELNLPLPAPYILAYVENQSLEPMWSVTDDANTLALPPPVSAETDNVLYGTLHQLVEELTSVTVFTSTPEDLSFGRMSIEQIEESIWKTKCKDYLTAFLRQHPHFTTSSALLAKLIERFMVPFSLKLGFENYRAHGITIDTKPQHIPHFRSQGETVVRRRKGDAGEQTASVTSSTNGTGSLMPEGSTLQFIHGTLATRSTMQRQGSHALGQQKGASPTGDWFAAPPASTSTEVITVYSKSASLFITVMAKIQIKVLSVLLLWLRRHPHHFDETMLLSVQHFVEVSCYWPTPWSDAPAVLSQFSEFIRSTASRLLGTLYEKQARAGGDAQEQKEAALRRRRVLSRSGDMRRIKEVRDTVPPTVRRRYENLQTWLSPAVYCDDAYLPAFAKVQRHAASTLLNPPRNMAYHAMDEEARVYYLSARAEAALELFTQFSLEEYVCGLTAAHLNLFALFPVEDLSVVAKNASAAFRLSDEFRETYLGMFLQCSIDLTEWATSLLMHAAFLDAAAAQWRKQQAANTSYVQSFSNEMGAAGMTQFIEDEWNRGNEEEGGDEDGEAGSNESSSSSLQGSGASDTSMSAVPLFFRKLKKIPKRKKGGDTEKSRASPQDDARRKSFVNNNSTTSIEPHSRKFVVVLSRLVDLVVAFLKLNNIHASYSIHRAFQHPFIAKQLSHPHVMFNVTVGTLNSLRRLHAFYTIKKTTTREDPLHEAGTKDGTTTTAAGAASEGVSQANSNQAREAREKFNFTSPEYINSIQDAAEHPIIPVVQQVVTELQRIIITEPSFLSVPLSGFHATEANELNEDPTSGKGNAFLNKLATTGQADTATDTATAAASAAAAASLPGYPSPPLATHAEKKKKDITRASLGANVILIHWRKFFIIDSLLQRVAALQQRAQFCVSSRSNLLKSVDVDLALERGFKEQLKTVVINDLEIEKDMTNFFLANF